MIRGWCEAGIRWPRGVQTRFFRDVARPLAGLLRGEPMAERGRLRRKLLQRSQRVSGRPFQESPRCAEGRLLAGADWNAARSGCPRGSRSYRDDHGSRLSDAACVFKGCFSSFPVPGAVDGCCFGKDGDGTRHLRQVVLARKPGTGDRGRVASDGRRVGAARVAVGVYERQERDGLAPLVLRSRAKASHCIETSGALVRSVFADGPHAVPDRTFLAKPRPACGFLGRPGVECFRNPFGKDRGLWDDDRGLSLSASPATPGLAGASGMARRRARQPVSVPCSGALPESLAPLATQGNLERGLVRRASKGTCVDQPGRCLYQQPARTESLGLASGPS